METNAASLVVSLRQVLGIFVQLPLDSWPEDEEEELKIESHLFSPFKRLTHDDTDSSS